jgi:hypothetical protein
MMHIQHDTAPAALAHAIEENGAEFLLAMGRAGGGAEAQDNGLHWTIGGSPIDYHNAVVRADLAPEQADDAIEGVVEQLRAHAVPGTWHLGPSMRPADLGERLLAHGWTYGGDDIGMAVELNQLPADVATPEGFVIERVRDAAGLEQLRRTLAAGFGEGEREANWTAAMYACIGLGDDVPWRHYLGLLDGEPVATASLFLGAGVAGIYFVFTVERARRKGIGAAITLAPLLDARQLGYRIGVLGASSLGESVYRRLGFFEYCRIGIYEWRDEGLSVQI